MDQRLTLDRASFERFLATASLLQQLQKRALSITAQNSHIEDLAPQLTDLVNTQQAIQTGSLTLDAALLRISALALRLVPAQGAGVWLFSGDALVYRAGAGTASDDESLRNAVSSKLAGSDHSAGIHQRDSDASTPLIRSFILAPIHQGQKIAGGLAVFSENTGCFTNRDEASARLLSGLATQALDKAANARFKQTVTLEREAVLHVIGALVPSLKDLVKTDPRSEREEGVRSVDSLANQINNLSAWTAEGSDLLITAHDFPSKVKNEKVQDSLSVFRTHEIAASTQGASEPSPIVHGALSSSLPFFEEWGPSVGTPDIEVTPHHETVAPLSAVESALVQDAVRAPATDVSKSTAVAAIIFAAAKQLRNHIAVLNAQTRIVSWFHFYRSLSARMVNLTTTSLSDVVANVSEIEFLAGHRLVTTTKRFGPAIALLIAAAVLMVITVVSRFRGTDAKISKPIAFHVNSVNTAKTPVLEGSHKRVTDNLTSAALADLSRFEIPGLLRQARYGDDSAAFLIGMAYETGRGVPQNCEKAARWVKDAAMGQNAAAEYNLSLRYRDGDGLAADPEQSERWLRKAAAQKYPQALTKAEVDQSGQTRAASSQP